MTDTFRSLCSELADSVELLLEMRAVDAKPMAITEDRLARARAALAQPEPVGVTDDQAEDLADALNFMDGYAEHEDGFYVCASNLGPFARAVLTRWGRPAIAPIPVSERLPCLEDCDKEGRCWFHSINRTWCDWYLLKASCITSTETHWLPFHALPLPYKQ